MNDTLAPPGVAEAATHNITRLIVEALASGRRARFAEAERLCRVAMALQRATGTGVDDFDEDDDDEERGGRRYRHRNPPGGDTAELLRGIVTVMDRSLPKPDPIKEESDVFARLVSEAQGLQRTLDGTGGFYGGGFIPGVDGAAERAANDEREYSPEEARLRAVMQTRLDSLIEELEKRNAKQRADVDDSELARRREAEEPPGGQVDPPHGDEADVGGEGGVEPPQEGEVGRGD